MYFDQPSKKSLGEHFWVIRTLSWTRSIKILNTTLWKVAATLHKPKGRNLQERVPHGHVKAILSWCLALIWIWLCPLKQSKNENDFLPARPTKTWWMKGKGKWSFFVALLSSLYSTHIIYYLLSFCIFDVDGVNTLDNMKTTLEAKI